MAFLEDHDWQGRVFSGRWVDGSGEPYDSVEPATGKVLGRVGAATPADLHRAVGQAAAAQRAWAALPYIERAQVLRRAGALFEKYQAEIADWIVRESGALRPFAEFQTSNGAAEECYEAAGLAAAPFGEVLRSVEDRLSFSRRRPVGVVGVISPFNAPMVLAMRAVAPALALGNAVVLKPDPRTAVCGGVTIARVFEEAGLPEGVLHVLPGGADVGAALVDNPRVPVIAFTGSTRAGKAIATAAAQRLKRVHLELGGNSALIVLEDADLDKAVSAGAFGSFHHAGQICMASSRHLVHASIAEEYTARLAERADAAPVGDPATNAVAVGPMIDEMQLKAAHSVVTDSLAAGARLAAGGTYEGLFYRPTVLADVPLTARAYTEEIFGPVAPVVAFQDLDEAVRLAADTEYGLSLGILTRDTARGLALADRIPTGLVHINDQTVNDEATVPFGGVGASGNGSRHGGVAANLEAFTEQQWVTVRDEIPVYPF
ncbi:aldehyde dehydrogenase family protein [Streptomyces sp. NBC_00582]|uniref:aldehyde dehydrogenase family protein n=1 Tax=Streptomyces sp. NBC_00582 TaxID=2975783 RepID=UPI002E81856F|nr:aldehyde dehydrogenase family protein [Streptomyces sp. NBC_00582]WUB67478.1 aldehyde dehydrogenase family protein [Streptomyces sp. NBC_00582]